MEQRGLRVIDTNKTFFSKITNTLTKMLIPTRVGINNLMITIKRNAVIKTYNEYKLNQDNNDKKESLLQKYEESYALYLEAIDKYIMDSVYKKVKNNTATAFEKEYLSKYYLIVSLKDKNYLEYKYKKQEYLLKIDYETASTIKKQSFLNKYKEFYVQKMDTIYKGLLKNYSIAIADHTFEKNNVYDKIFTTLEEYTINILPIKIEQTRDKDLIEIREKYENSIIGKLDQRDIILKKMILIEISRQVFTHSLPLSALEKCYIVLIKEARDMIQNSKNEIKREKAYKTFFEIVEEYNKKLLSTKVFWTNPKERENYKKFWDKYTMLETDEQKEVLILKYDLKMLDKDKYKEIRKLYKEKLVQAGAMKTILNIPKTFSNISYKEVKREKKLG